MKFEGPGQIAIGSRNHVQDPAANEFYQGFQANELIGPRGLAAAVPNSG